MLLKSLGYLGAYTPDLDAWRRFGADFLGMQVAEQDNRGLSFRMDGQAQRLQIQNEDAGNPHFIGWEVSDAQALDQIAARIEAAGIGVTLESSTLAEQRLVKALISCADPAGNRLEIYYGAAQANELFVPGRAIAGFRTGSQGLGHIVLTVRNLDQVLPFYRDVLGFGVSDYVLNPYKGYFLHLNSRHHSLALIEATTNAIHHFMIELIAFDDLGHGYDIILQTPDRIGQTLGRHTNDYMTSFYTRSPSGFMVETGWGGRQIDPQNWETVELTEGPSIWGHERLWLAPQARASAQAVTLSNGTNGLRQPVQVLPGHYQAMTTDTGKS
ncbi:MAG: VOC family protein [Burkholderiaceae bacterium]